MISVDIGTGQLITVMNGDSLKVTPDDEWAAVRCNGTFIIITPTYFEELRGYKLEPFVEGPPPHD